MHTCTIDVLVKGLSDYDFSSALIKKKQDKAASAPSEVLSHRMRAEVHPAGKASETTMARTSSTDGCVTNVLAHKGGPKVDTQTLQPFSYY